MKALLDRRFGITDRGSSVPIEALGGVSTFLTMSYILFVNPAILSAAGIPFAAVAVATALAAAVATIAMGLLANYPFALASGLGLNAVVAFDVILGRKVGWPVGMACVVIEGLLALVLVVAGLREAVVRAGPPSLRWARACARPWAAPCPPPSSSRSASGSGCSSRSSDCARAASSSTTRPRASGWATSAPGRR